MDIINGKKNILTVCLSLAVMVTIILMFTVTASAGTFKTTEIDMKPGNTYDIAKAGNSTQYTITKSGQYWIKGSSSKAFVRIKGGKNVEISTFLSWYSIGESNRGRTPKHRMKWRF